MGNKTGEKVEELDINRLVTSEFNPRKDLGDITELIANIKQKGIEEPLIVRESKSAKGKWEVVIGERRHKAAKKLNLKTLPCIKRKFTDPEAAEASLSENIHRKNLTSLEEAIAIKALSERYPERYPTHRSFVDKLNVSEARISQLFDLASYPKEVKTAVKKERITAEHARILNSKLKSLKFKGLRHWIKRIDNEKLSTEKLKSKLYQPKIEAWPEETRMYIEAEPFPSFFVGCKYHCKYCIPTFQRQAKRQKHRCKKCYRYEPHFHSERLNVTPPKTEGKKGFLFLNDFSDVSFATRADMCATIGYCFIYPDRKFWLQSKNPTCFLTYRFPENVYLSTTIETNRDELARRYSNAPLPSKRIEAMVKLDHPNKAITIEPILDFDLEPLLKWIKNISPKVVYIGYDSHPKENKLEEPSLARTKELIKELKKLGIEVREKLIRKAWWEDKIKIH